MNQTIVLFEAVWDSKTNHHSPLHVSDVETHTDHSRTLSVDATIQAYLAAGVPAHQLVMGVPLYGRGWKGK
jgi:chitinase